MIHPETSFSELARPSVRYEEAHSAPDAICRMHKGLIASAPTEADRDGTVYFCPIGRQYWRYSSEPNGMYGPLRYPRSGIV